MSLLRMQNRTPPVYCEESRDFQLLCRLYDTIVNGLLFDIDTITDLINTRDIRSSFLQLLQTKLGFFTLHNFDENTLRYTLNGFPRMVRYKGSKKSIEYAVNTFLKINNIISPVTVTFQETPLLLANGYTVPDHTIVIGISASLQDSAILEEIFRYILPAGTIYYFYYYSTTKELTNIVENDGAIVLYVSDNINSILRSDTAGDFMDSFKNITNEKKRLIGGVDTINLITSYFDELGDIIYTDDENNSFAPGNELLFLGVHYDKGSLSDYITANFDSTTFVDEKTIIVFNEKEYLYVDSNWEWLKILPATRDLSNVDNPSAYNIVYKDASTTTDGKTISEIDQTRGYYIYDGSAWNRCYYPIYVLGQQNAGEQQNAEEE